MLVAQDHAGLASLLDRLHSATTAGLCEELTADEIWRFLAFAPLERQAEVFSLLSATRQVEMVGGAGQDRMSHLLEAMPHDDRVDLLKRLDPAVVENLLPLVAQVHRQDICNLLQYPEHTAGALMTTDYVSIPAHMTVAETMAFLRQQARARETIYYIYVVDAEHSLVGIASLRDLILADPAASVGDIMEREFISVSADQDQEQVALQLARFDFLAIPVVENGMRLVGIVTHDDVIDVMVAEATEDALRMGSVGAMDQSYLAAPFTTVWRKRACGVSVPPGFRACSWRSFLRSRP
jgi:magnesium transporter